MDNVFQKIINDEIFETTYYRQFLDKIYSWEEYKTLSKLLPEHNFTIEFSFFRDQDFSSITYFIEFDILDSNGDIVSVPDSSDYFDLLFSLGGCGQVLYLKKKSREVVIEFSEKELKEDMKFIAEYLTNSSDFSN